MTLEEVNRSINKGAPCFLDIEIDMDVLKNECAIDKQAFQEKMIKAKKQLKNQLVDLNNRTKYKFSDFFLKKLIVSPNFNDSISSFKFSQIDYLRKLKEILCVEDDSLDYNNQNLINKLNQKVKELGSITTKEELEDKFPEIYKDFVFAKQKNRDLRDQKICALTLGDQDMVKKVNDQWKIYNQYGLSPEIENFIPRQAYLYRNMVVRKNFQEEFCKKTPIDESLFVDLDKDKTETYIASKYLEKAKETESIEEKQMCLFYLIPYLTESRYKSIEVKDENGVNITPKKIYRECNKMMKENPELVTFIQERNYYKGRNHKYSKNSINKHLPANTRWELLPAGEKLPVIHPGITIPHYKTEQELQEEMQRDLEQFKRKQNFYSDSNFIYRLNGQGDFSGYQAFVYENGETILDKFYEDNIGITPARDVAIYNIKAVDFIALSKLPKTTLMKDKRVKRIYHTDNWEDRVEEIIKKPVTIKSQQEVNNLGDTLKVKVYK